MPIGSGSMEGGDYESNRCTFRSEWEVISTSITWDEEHKILFIFKKFRREDNREVVYKRDTVKEGYLQGGRDLNVFIGWGKEPLAFDRLKGRGLLGGMSKEIPEALTRKRKLTETGEEEGINGVDGDPFAESEEG